MRDTGIFIMVDGMTGSGKSTILQSIYDWALSANHRVFRLQDWTHPNPPTFEELPDADVYFTYEPTRTWVGSAIRYELSRTDQPYSGEELAHAFALDRHVMYKRLILPALNAGKTIIQDRGISSSIVYQPVMRDSVPLETLLQLPGNKLALEHAPTALILTHVSADTAHARITARSDESKGVFADLSFLRQQEERFASDWFRQLFTEHGTQIHTLDTSQTLDKTQQQAIELIKRVVG